jgi:hypothetical protein
VLFCLIQLSPCTMDFSSYSFFLKVTTNILLHFIKVRGCFDGFLHKLFSETPPFLIEMTLLKSLFKCFLSQLVSRNLF